MPIVSCSFVRWTLQVAAVLAASLLVYGRPAACAESGQEIFESAVQPLLKQYCVECHSGDLVEADIDLSESNTSARPDNVKVWLKVRSMLDSRQMPPKDSSQPSDEQHRAMSEWVRQFLLERATESAGDPGPVVVRRLNNDEYNYTVQDLTGVPTLNPTREFPIDGAAGEGFINSGEGQSMSPSLVAKYLDAAKEVADHAVLTPNGIVFSQHRTRRDWSDERIAAIRQFYERYTVSRHMKAEVGGAGNVPNEGGTVSIEEYLAASLHERDALADASKTIEQAAEQHGLNAIYLSQLWEALNSSESTFLLRRLQEHWRGATPADSEVLLAAVQEYQDVLFKFNPIGHIGPDGKPKTWMEGVDPVVTSRSFEMEIPETKSDDVSIFLTASDAGDGSADDLIRWKNPRLVLRDGEQIPLRLLHSLQDRLKSEQKKALSRTADYLAAVAEMQSNDATTDEVARGAKELGLREAMLQAWINYVGIGPASPVSVSGHFEKTETNGTYDFVRSWGTGATPSIGANASDQQVRIPGIANPRKIFAHPSPTLYAAIGWQSPVRGMMSVKAAIKDAHPECGSGQVWLLQHRSGQRITDLWSGEFGAGGSEEMDEQFVEVRKGDLVSFILSPGREYSCDLAQMDVTITETTGAKRQWDLANDVSADLLASNPHRDSFGNGGVWHFYKGEVKDIKRSGVVGGIPAGSRLAKWKNATGTTRAALARQVQELATKGPSDNTDAADAELYRQLRDLAMSSFDISTIAGDLRHDPRFGKHPQGGSTSLLDLVVQAPTEIEFKALAKLVAGAKLLVDVELADGGNGNGTAQVAVGFEPSASKEFGLDSPVLVKEGSIAQQRVLSGFNDFRQLFPPQFCYSQIVPVDEVVTSTLFYRQDEALQRLLLTEGETQSLNGLWDELFFVAQEPLQYEVAFEQIRAFATQDRADLVKIWDPLKDSIRIKAELFRQRMISTQPTHLDATVDLAGRAWRRPLTTAEDDQLRGLYWKLRDEGLGHEASIRLTIARILTSPTFLYRRESQSAGTSPHPITGAELASRLSYFLWSSTPDQELLEAGADESILQNDVLLRQTRRMLKDDRVRRLAIQFACQWLHLRNFDQNNDKNEKRYPEFVDLRSHMYEETIRFFEDLFRDDRSILGILDSNHTFLNEELARHYQVAGVTGSDWRRVEDWREQGRGGVLGMGSLLAAQSGASRTSPILRGNWIFETLLGERLPRPPPDVPQLPEQVPSGLTARQLIEKHSSAPECAKCHALIDPFGFSLEQFDTIGRMREEKMDTSTRLTDAEEIDGLAGLRDYLLTNRRDDVVRQFCRKLLGFALGREVQLSDEPLLAEMQARLERNGFRFSVAVEAIVTSRQFREIRGSDHAVE